MTARVDTRAAKERAERILAHGRAAFEAGWQGDLATGYFEDEDAVKAAYEQAEDVLALVGLLADTEKALRLALECKGPYAGTVARFGGDPAVCRDCEVNIRAALAAFDAAGGAETP